MAQDVSAVFDNPDNQADFINNIGDGEHIGIDGLRGVAQDHGFIGNRIVKFIPPSESNNDTAMVIQRVYMMESDVEIRAYEGLGDANVGNCSGKKTKESFIRVASTRALRRAFMNALKTDPADLSSGPIDEYDEDLTDEPVKKKTKKTSAKKRKRPAQQPPMAETLANIDETEYSDELLGITNDEELDDEELDDEELDDEELDDISDEDIFEDDLEDDFGENGDVWDDDGEEDPLEADETDADDNPVEEWSDLDDQDDDDQADLSEEELKKGLLEEIRDHLHLQHVTKRQINSWSKKNGLDGLAEATADGLQELIELIEKKIDKGN